MIAIFAAFALIVGGLFLWLFLVLPPATVARSLTLVGAFLLGALGLFLTVTGRVGAAMLVFTGCLALWRAGRGVGSISMPGGGGWSGGRDAGGDDGSGGEEASTVRTDWLAMRLDHSSGEIGGEVLKGPFAGRQLGSLDEAELRALLAELSGDAESSSLLETYLDGRTPGWRESADGDAGARQGDAAAAGGMGEQEAYEILGLEPGASAAEIRKAHRSLMQRVHPDAGGSPALAARVNWARDLLLSRHR